jgi:internalin A
LKHLKGMKLEHLSLRTTRITDRGIDEIKGMTTLQDLDVVDTKVTNAALAKLKPIPDLKVFGLPREEVREIPDDPADAAALEEGTLAAAGVNISKDNVTDNIHMLWIDPGKENRTVWMKHLKGLHSLEELELPAGTTDDDLKYVVGLKSLEKLVILGDAYSDEGLKCVGSLTNLKELLCGCKRVSSAGVKHLAPLVNLEFLDLSESPIDDEALRSLAGMKRLKKLGLNSTKITDAGLAHLRPLSSLYALELMSTSVTDAGLENLRGLKGLSQIRGAGSREEMLRLKKDLPDLLVPEEEERDWRPKRIVP